MLDAQPCFRQHFALAWSARFGFSQTLILAHHAFLVMTETIYFYGTKGEHGCLSNFFPCKIIHKGILYTSAEQAMMHHKALLFNDSVRADAIMATNNPAECKKLGRKVTPYVDSIWVSARGNIVSDIIRDKFTQNAAIGKHLVGTFPSTLAEASPSDRIWGIGLSVQNAEEGKQWRGTNLLGNILMTTRDQHLDASRKWTPPAKDIEIVVEQCKVSPEIAVRALQANYGDVVNAIMAVSV